jgi:hypothetical protein
VVCASTHTPRLAISGSGSEGWEGRERSPLLEYWVKWLSTTLLLPV